MSRPEVLFDGIADRLALEISKSKSSIYVAVAWLSDEKLFNALVAKAKQGVMVRLMISNDEQTQKNNQKLDYKILNGFGDSDVSLVKPEVGGLMHNKLCIIDRLTVITGSYNWTYYADNKNHENIFIFQDREVAETCIRHFKDIINHYLEVTPKPHYFKQNHKHYDKNKNHHQKNTNTPSPQNDDTEKPTHAKQEPIKQDNPKPENPPKPQKTDKELMDKNIAKSDNSKQEQTQPKPEKPKSQEIKQPKPEPQSPPKSKTDEELAEEYYKNSNYKLAFEYYEKSAQLGNADAQCRLGCMYRYGDGVEKDYVKAVKWFTKSAEQGNAEAQNYLGSMYKYGNGVEQDYTKSLEWYTKSAEQGYKYAQSNLGDMYRHGCGVEKDDAKAIEWYTKSAKQGNWYAKYTLKDDYSIII